MIDRETWILLAERLEEIRRARQRLTDELDDSIELIFDKHDQASIAPTSLGGTTA